MRYYSPIKFSATNIGPEEPGYLSTASNSVNRNIWPAAYTFNLNVSYDVIKEDDGRRLQAYVAVDNLFDRDPPIIWTQVSNYDVVGRYFKVGLRYSLP
jgi:outer membrane receptor protein involved in Fe transport